MKKKQINKGKTENKTRQTFMFQRMLMDYEDVSKGWAGRGWQRDSKGRL